MPRDGAPESGRLDSWKEIGAYLRRDARTAQTWEKQEGLPVHRHTHNKRGTVYAYQSEIDAWWKGRRATLGEERTTSEPHRRVLPIVGITAIVILGGAAVFAAWRMLHAPMPETRMLPLTSYPGTETGSSFSPDGSQVAFAWEREGKGDFDIYVKVVGSDKPLQLTNTPEWDTSPAWSPDGRQIAFYRSSKDGRTAIYTVSPLGGSERLRVELNWAGAADSWPTANPPRGQLSWSPDGKWLAYPDMGIWLLAVDTGERRRLTSSEPGVRPTSPAFSPDGRWIAFLRTGPSGKQELYSVSAGGGDPRRIPTVSGTIFGLCWTADGQEIVYSAGNAGWAEADLWRVAVSGGSPRRVREAGENGWYPSMSRSGRRLAFTRRFVDTNIWQVELPQNGSLPRAAKWISSTRTEAAPAFSPDGSRIAFNSNRSGTLQVWTCNRDGSNPTQLTDLPEPGGSLGAWSPDGAWLAFDSRVRGKTDVYIIAARGGTPRLLTPDSSDHSAPTWSRDGRWIYFTSNRTGRFDIWKAPAAGGAATQLTRNGGYRPVESADGRFVYYEQKGGSYDVARIAVGGGEEEVVFQDPHSRWALAGEGVYFFAQNESRDKWLLSRYDFATKRAKPMAELPGTPTRGQRPAISPDGRSVLYTQLDAGEADLMLLENFR